MKTPSMLQILLVEDDPGMVVLARERLVDVAGWEVTAAESAEQCRSLLACRKFDVVLLDRGLPDCDGALLIAELLAALPDAAIVMLTGADSAVSATETLKLGACDYIVKQPDLSHLDELPAVIGRCIERSQWRREEARLRSEMELLLTAIRNTGDAVIMADCDRNVQFWNVAAERLFGWRAEEILGKPLPMIPPDREQESIELTERARRGDRLVGVETVRQRRDGSLVEVSLTLTAAVEANGSVRSYVAVIRDISERKAIERARADFAAMLTHDIRNPLAVVRGCAEMLAESELHAEDRESVAAIHHAAETIERLVVNLLMSATIEAGQLSLAPSRVPVDTLLTSTVEQFRAAASRQRVGLKVAPSEACGFVNGDRLQLERALGNLINNAIKYTGPGGNISVAATRQNGSVLFQVRDDGPGIDDRELPYLFDKYRRVRGTQQIDGAGLGLYIVRHLIEAHGGSVTVCSTPGEGSVFTIHLPAEHDSGS
jgi:two-component system sensor histidine kinase ResE